MNDTENKTATIRRLNDQLRTAGIGGRIIVTRGIQALDERTRAEVLAAVVAFEDWSEDVDRHGEHDFVGVEVKGTKVFAKIDYYDLQMQFLSPDPSDAAVTKRVLTIMLAQEY